MKRNYWLMKSEPTTFSFRDLMKMPGQKSGWDGVRNYQARNFMRDQMKVGDGVFFYHSVTPPIGIFGTATVVKESHPDPTQFDEKSKYYDPKARPENPRWFMVEIQADEEFAKPVTLEMLKDDPRLDKMKVLQKGSRLSVQPVSEEEWRVVRSMAKKAN